MPCCYRLNEPDYKIPSTLIKCYEIVGENEKGDVFKIEADNNHSRFVLHKTDWNIVSVRLVPKETYGDKNFRIFGFEVS